VTRSPESSYDREMRPRLALALALCGCGAPAPVPAPSSTAAAPAKVEPAAAASPSPVAEPAVAAEPDVATPVVAAPPVVVAPPPATTAPAVEPVMLALPESVDAAAIGRRTVEWKLVRESTDDVELAPLHRGVVATIERRPFEIGPDGALVDGSSLTPDFVLTLAGPPGGGGAYGAWPDDAWRNVEVIDREDPTIRHVHRFQHRDGEWHERNIADDVSGAVVLESWSPRGGLLMGSNVAIGEYEFLRLGTEAPPPKRVAMRDVGFTALFESRDGALFLFGGPTGPVSGTSKWSFVLARRCDGPTPGCGELRSVALPRDPKLPYVAHSVRASAARGESNVTIALERAGVGAGRRLLVHWERDGFLVEEAPDNRRVERVVAAGDGSIWVKLAANDGDSLWQRSDRGQWVGVDLPARAANARFDIAMRDDTELWIAVNAADHHALYRTSASFP
jgi:hypothetical protein